MNIYLVMIVIMAFADSHGRPATDPAKQETFEKKLENMGVKSRILAIAPSLNLDCTAPAEVLSKEANRFRADKYHVFTFDEAQETLLHYVHSEPRHIPLVRSKPMSKEEAVLIAKDFLAKIDAMRDFTNAEIEYLERPGGRDCGVWNITIHDFYHGIRFMGGTYISIPALAGQVVSYHLSPFQAPESIEQRITAEQAVKIAAAFASTKGKSDLQIQEPPELLIAHPENRMTAAPGEPIHKSEKTRLCWNVRCAPPVDSNETDLIPQRLKRGGYILVDCATGDINGGSLP